MPRPSALRALYWLGGAGVLLLLGLLLHGSEQGVTLLLAINDWGARWPSGPSWLSVAGLGVSLLLLGGLFGPRHATLLAALLLILLGGGLVVQLLKLALWFPRPLAVLGADVVQVVGIPLGTRAMPSGHSAAAFAAATLVCLLLPGRAWGLAALAFAVAVALARVAVGAHWPADVLVGAALGVLLSLALLRSQAGRAAVTHLAAAMASRAGSRNVAALLVFAAAFVWVAEREYPLAEAAHATLALAGVAAAWRWWRWHPGSWRRRGLPVLRRRLLSRLGEPAKVWQ